MSLTWNIRVTMKMMRKIKEMILRQKVKVQVIIKEKFKKDG